MCRGPLASVHHCGGRCGRRIWKEAAATLVNIFTHKSLGVAMNRISDHWWPRQLSSRQSPIDGQEVLLGPKTFPILSACSQRLLCFLFVSFFYTALYRPKGMKSRKQLGLVGIGPDGGTSDSFKQGHSSHRTIHFSLFSLIIESIWLFLSQQLLLPSMKILALTRIDRPENIQTN